MRSCKVNKSENTWFSLDATTVNNILHILHNLCTFLYLGNSIIKNKEASTKHGEITRGIISVTFFSIISKDEHSRRE